MTYKLLYNDAVAMTGGQPAEGAPTVLRIAAQLHAEGVGLIAVVADDPARLPSPATLPPGTLRHGRDEMDAVQRRMREHDGVSAIIYDQVCATEKRRRRKRGKAEAADHSCRDQHPGLRELRRLHGAVELHRHRARRDRIRPQAPHQPDELQHRPLLPQGLLPELRDDEHSGTRDRPCRGMAVEGGRARGRARRARSAQSGPTLARPVRRHRRRRDRDLRRHRRDGRASRGPCRQHPGFHRPCAEERRSGEPRASGRRLWARRRAHPRRRGGPAAGRGPGRGGRGGRAGAMRAAGRGGGKPGPAGRGRVPCGIATCGWMRACIAGPSSGARTRRGRAGCAGAWWRSGCSGRRRR